MIREHLFHKRAPADPMFRWRGGEISRIEGLSDGVFAVTLTLLIVSVDVPRTFYELWRTIRDIPAFLACFILLMMAWRYHYMFFRRYGLEDFLSSFLNGVFLFLIVFMAYPLKFMATFLWRLILREPTGPMFVVPEGVEWTFSDFMQRAGMMYFYALALIGVFGVLALMVYRAYRLRDELELDELERFLTLASIRAHLITVVIASISILVMVLGGNPGWAGVVYFAMGPAYTADGIYTASRADRLHKKLIAEAEGQQRANPSGSEDR